MTIDEAIAHAREVVENNRKTAKECLMFNQFQKADECVMCAEEYEQLANWLEELKVIKEMDLSIPQHFTKEQSDWIKEYCINRNKEFYNKAIDNFVHECDNHCGFYKGESKNITREDILKIAEQLKEQTND